MSYYDKYLKYKNKYLELKNQIGGALKVGDRAVHTESGVHGEVIEIKSGLRMEGDNGIIYYGSDWKFMPESKYNEDKILARQTEADLKQVANERQAAIVAQAAAEAQAVSPGAIAEAEAAVEAAKKSYVLASGKAIDTTVIYFDAQELAELAKSSKDAGVAAERAIEAVNRAREAANRALAAAKEASILASITDRARNAAIRRLEAARVATTADVLNTEVANAKNAARRAAEAVTRIETAKGTAEWALAEAALAAAEAAPQAVAAWSRRRKST
jgi:hypothetical protein